MNDNQFLEDLAKADVVTRGNYLKAGKGLAVIKSVRKEPTRDGDAGILDIIILKVQQKGNEPPNAVGEVATKMYMFEKGDKDRRGACFANFKRDVCAIDGTDPKSVKPDKLAKIIQACWSGAYKGMLIGFDSYDSKTKKGEGRTYHNFITIQQTPAEVAKRVKLIDAGAEASAFL